MLYSHALPSASTVDLVAIGSFRVSDKYAKIPYLFSLRIGTKSEIP